jgi:hypothetical protein
MRAIVVALMLLALSGCDTRDSMVGVWAFDQTGRTRPEFRADGQCVNRKVARFPHGCFWRNIGDGNIDIDIAPAEFHAQLHGDTLTIKSASGEVTTAHRLK